MTPLATDADLDLVQVFRRHYGKMLLAFALVVRRRVCLLRFGQAALHVRSRLFIRLGRETVGLDPTATNNQVISVQDAARTK